jgi:hypothetical protein
VRSLLENLCGRGLNGVGLSRDVARAVKKTGRVVTGAGLASESKAEKWLADGVDSLVADSIGTD